jgi:hypothetical protein
LPAHSTVTVDATEAVPAGARAYGRVVAGCDFGQFGAGFWDGFTHADAASALVTS